MTSPTYRPETVAVHGAAPQSHAMNAVTVPIVCSATFPFESFEEAQAVVERRSDRHDYSRYGNPTVRQAEQLIAALEGADDSVLFSSGMAALTAVLMTFTGVGAHVVLLTECYRPTEQLIRETMARFGVECTLVPGSDLQSVKNAVIPGRTRLLMLEAPTNPHLRVADLQALAEWKRTVKGLRMVVDATLATPYNMKPLELGADIVVQSATKFLGGHNDLLAGSVAGRVGLMQAVRDVRGRTGAVADPHSAYLLVRGIKSLAPRMRQHNESALNIASYLESCPQIKRVWYPGLASHPDFHMASRLLGGFGGLLSFEHTGDLEFTRVFCNSLKLVQLAASLGGVESLCHPPALFSYWDLPRSEREQLGMPDSLIRLSVGLESADDIKADLTQALEKAAMATA